MGHSVTHYTEKVTTEKNFKICRLPGMRKQAEPWLYSR